MLLNLLLHSSLPRSTLLYSILRYSTLLNSKALPPIAPLLCVKAGCGHACQPTALLYSTLLFSTLPFSTLLYSTVLVHQLFHVRAQTRAQRIAATARRRSSRCKKVAPLAPPARWRRLLSHAGQGAGPWAPMLPPTGHGYGYTKFEETPKYIKS